MERSIKKQVQVTLVLNEKEALYLKGLVQNPMCNPDEEDEEIKKLRYSFWKALEDVQW